MQLMGFQKILERGFAVDIEALSRMMLAMGRSQSFECLREQVARRAFGIEWNYDFGHGRRSELADHASKFLGADGFERLRRRGRIFATLADRLDCERCYSGRRWPPGLGIIVEPFITK